MKEETIMELTESYINGNIGYVRTKVKLMTKAQFIDFAEHCRSYGIRLDELRKVV